MGYFAVRHLILPALAAVFVIRECSGADTYDHLVSQLRPQLRGGKGVIRHPIRPAGVVTRPRPTRPIKCKNGTCKGGPQGRFISIGTDSSSTSTDIKQFQGIYIDGEPNMTAEAIYSQKENNLKPHINIGGVKLGVDITINQEKESTISLGGHPAENSSSQSASITIQAIANVPGLGLGPPPVWVIPIPPPPPPGQLGLPSILPGINAALDGKPLPSVLPNLGAIFAPPPPIVLPSLAQIFAPAPPPPPPPPPPPVGLFWPPPPPLFGPLFGPGRPLFGKKK